LVDNRSSFDGSDGVSEVGDIPDVEILVSSSGGKIFGVGGDGNSVDSSVMGFEVSSDLEVGVPDFESTIPTDRSEIGFESNFTGGFEHGRISNT